MRLGNKFLCEFTYTGREWGLSLLLILATTNEVKSTKSTVFRIPVSTSCLKPRCPLDILFCPWLPITNPLLHSVNFAMWLDLPSFCVPCHCPNPSCIFSCLDDFNNLPRVLFHLLWAPLFTAHNDIRIILAKQEPDYVTAALLPILWAKPLHSALRVKTRGLSPQPAFSSLPPPSLSSSSCILEFLSLGHALPCLANAIPSSLCLELISYSHPASPASSLLA